ncbi:hypothetical protein [Helicovermis profundi]|uniref:Uncharacterized protein n=1 Tax=Helicovermis profundi TaxID=3065157 RepID=A0AAU9EJN2_9FIRM|nr:hypothetical protein HLPR_21240 [Clostridia bacterium S502]
MFYFSKNGFNHKIGYRSHMKREFIPTTFITSTVIFLVNIFKMLFLGKLINFNDVVTIFAIPFVLLSLVYFVQSNYKWIIMNKVKLYDFDVNKESKFIFILIFYIIEYYALLELVFVLTPENIIIINKTNIVMYSLVFLIISIIVGLIVGNYYYKKFINEIKVDEYDYGIIEKIN